MFIQKMVKIDRISAWVLFVGMLVYFITGYGMTKGLIAPAFATKLHTGFLNYVIAIAFITHTSFAIHLAFKRWKIWSAGTAALLALIFIFLGCGFVYLDKFYIKEAEDEVSATQSVNASANTSTGTNQSSQKTFTLTELAKYDGKNGQPAYVAVDGLVYDLSTVFRSGSHFSHYAGTELTNAFYSYHAKSAISKYPVVGKLAK